MSFKKTPQRLSIIEYLKDNKSHPSALDIYNAISQRHPRISFNTIYNTCEILKKHGTIRELSIDPDKKRFDPNVTTHNHIICIKCKKIADISRNFVIDIAEDERNDFEIVGISVEFYGICRPCSKAKAKRNIRKSK